MSKHTPEKSWLTVHGDALAAPGKYIAEVDSSVPPARLVAAVNACTSIPTSALSEGCVRELVETLKRARGWVDLCEDLGKDVDSELMAIDAALAPFTKEGSDQEEKP